MTLAPDDPRHGTLGGYTNHHCRCDECKAAVNAYRRERVRRHLPPGDTRHGTLNGYIHYRCRCPECTRANADYYRVRRQRGMAHS